MPARDWRQILALVLVTLIVWCSVYNRWTPEAWQTPIEYGTTPTTTDAKGVLAMVKAAQDGHLSPFGPKFVPELNAPFGANWDDMPIIEQSQFYLTGMVARVIGLFPAVNLSLLVAQLLAALTFYGVARVWGARWTWAMAGALLFAFSRMALARQIHHLPVVFYWHIPLDLLVCKWIAENSLGEKRRFQAALIVAVLTGLQNPYYTNMFIQLAGLSSLVCLARREFTSGLRGIAVCATALGTFLLMTLNTVIFTAKHGANSGAIVRLYSWLEVFALKPLDLFMPPPDHPIKALANWSAHYFPQTLVSGEMPPSNYLGIFGILALLALIGVCIARTIRRPPQALPMEAWQILWIAAYSIVGGFNGAIGALGVQLFRSSNRFSIFILAIVLLWAMRQLSQLEMPKRMGFLLAMLVAVAGLWDELPQPVSINSIRAVEARVASDRALTEEMERRLPAGSMVFQFPPAPFPESSAPGLPAYDHFRPYLFSRQLSFSYGAVKGRERDNWQYVIFNQDLKKALQQLKEMGFGALYIYKPSLNDGGAGILKELKAAGYPDHFTDAMDETMVIPLGPAPSAP